MPCLQESFAQQYVVHFALVLETATRAVVHLEVIADQAGVVLSTDVPSVEVHLSCSL